ncbi:MAG: hypothetical protein HZB31_14390 [Nitrospirae bacterium]|nr:hypothetical protein [Nitrospirota bacterium]
MQKSKILSWAIPLMIVMLLLGAYKYAYRDIRAGMASVREEQEIKIKLLLKYMGLIAQKPQIEKQISLLKAERKSDDLKLIDGQTPSLAAATLQEIIKGIVVEKGGTISSERVEKPEDMGKFRIITISMDTVLPDTAALSEILYSIETRTPYLMVKELDARVKNIREPRELMVKMDISAMTASK